MTENIIVQILEPSINVLEIETQVGSEPINVSILSYSGTNISITHDLPVLPSDINDNIASLLVAGSGINIVYNNNIPSVVISSSGNETLDAEQVEDIVGNLIIGSGYIISSYDDLSNKLIISSSGLQPSGNYALINHTHASNDITDFNISVGGLIPVKNILAGNNIGIANSGGEYTVSVTGQLGLTSEQVDDRVSSLLQPGQYILLSYNDSADTLSVSVTGLQPSGNYSLQGHTHLSSDITNFNSATSGIINSTLSTSISGGIGIDISYYSNTDTLLISTSGVSLVGHQHTSSEITNFNTSVSGLLTSYAPLNSPNFSGTPTVPTATSGTNTNQIASTSFVRNEISSLVNSAPTTLDTLNELALALGNDPNFATTIASGLGQKANLIHTHSVSDITNFNSGVSGLLPVTNIIAGTNIGVVSSGTAFTINTSGLQPSGNYSLVGHTHTSSDITDFNSSTSGIINSTLSTSISGGVGIDVSYYSNTDTLLISTSGVSLVGHQHTYSEITDFNTGVRLNRINDLTVPSGNVSFNNYRLTNLATPTSGTDAVTKSYIDTLYASTSGLGIASFSSGDFSVVSGIVSVKNSGIDNNQLYYSNITLGSSVISLGSTVTTISGLVLDGGSP